MRGSVNVVVVWRRLVLVACALLAGAARVSADQTTASIVVNVVAPVGVTAQVDLSTGGMPGGAADNATVSTRHRTIAVSGGSRRGIHHLPPGRYDIVVRLSDGSTTESALLVSAGELVVLDIVQTSSSPSVDVVRRRRPGQSVDFTAGELRELPGADTLWALLDAAEPFVVTDGIDGGGLRTGSWARIGSRGASWTKTSLFVGDMELETPGTRGVMSFYPDLSAMDAVSVYSGLLDTDFASPGAAIALTPRRPGTERHGAVGGAITTPGMVTNEALGRAPYIGRISGWNNGFLQWGGPLTDRVGAFVSGSFSRVRSRERDQVDATAASASSFLANIVATLNDRDELRLLAVAQHVERPFDGRRALHDANVRESDGIVNVQATWNRRGDSGAERELSVGVQRAALTPDGMAAADGVVDRD